MSSAIRHREVGSTTMGRAVRYLRKDWAATAGAVALVVIAVLLAAAPLLARHDPLAVSVGHRLAPFSLAHPLGTDGIGRDMWARVLYGGRTSVAITLAVTSMVTTIGLVLGVAAGVGGGVLDGVVNRTVEIVQSVPLIIVVMVAVKLIGGGTPVLIMVLIAVGWTGQARVVRAEALSLREREFVVAARLAGASWPRTAVRHVAPNLLRPVVVLATLDIGRILLVVSTLSFLGFGAHPPHPEWGSMLADARNYFFVAPRLLVIPGVAIALVALAANLCGEGLRDSLQARTETR